MVANERTEIFERKVDLLARWLRMGSNAYADAPRWWKSPDVVMRDVSAERRRQDERWGAKPADCPEWFPILFEEVYEVSLAINDDQSVAALRDELVQVAAVAVAWAQALDRADEPEFAAWTEDSAKLAARWPDACRVCGGAGKERVIYVVRGCGSRPELRNCGCLENGYCPRCGGYRADRVEGVAGEYHHCLDCYWTDSPGCWPPDVILFPLLRD